MMIFKNSNFAFTFILNFPNLLAELWSRLSWPELETSVLGQLAGCCLRALAARNFVGLQSILWVNSR